MIKYFCHLNHSSLMVKRSVMQTCDEQVFISNVKRVDPTWSLPTLGLLSSSQWKNFDHAMEQKCRSHQGKGLLAVHPVLLIVSFHDFCFSSLNIGRGQVWRAFLSKSIPLSAPEWDPTLGRLQGSSVTKKRGSESKLIRKSVFYFRNMVLHMYINDMEKS